MKVVDCRICGDPNSVLRFAFIEFTDEGSVGWPYAEIIWKYKCEELYNAVMAC